MRRLRRYVSEHAGGKILDAAREIAFKVAGLKADDRKLYIAQAAQAVEQFDAEQVELQELAKSAGQRIIGGARLPMPQGAW